MFDQSGNLYGVKGKNIIPSFFLEIDKSTGTGTNMGMMGIKNITGMAARLDRSMVGIEDELPLVPAAFTVSQNYPNPFNPSTDIQYALPASEHVKLVIYNVLGQKVRTLVSDQQSAGYYTVRWDGHDQSGKSVGSGMYIYRVIAGAQVASRKMILMR